MSPRVLVTGAGGFVGSALALGFAALGWRVTGLDRTFDDATRARLAGVDLETADLERGVPEHVPPANLVLHAAAVTTGDGELGWTRAAHIAANTRPLLAVLEHAARARPDAFVYLSSSGVFAAGDGTQALTDADAPTGRSPYAAAKRAGEVLAHGALDGAVKTHVVRLGYIFGPHEASRPSRTRVSLVAEWLTAAREGRPLAVPADDPARDWTFAPDLAPALARLAAGQAASRPVHVCSPYVSSDSALAALVAGHYPGTTCVTREAGASAVKPPMAPSDIPALRDFVWTHPTVAIASLVAAERAA